MTKETETNKRTHQHEEVKEEEDEHHVDQPVRNERHRQAVAIPDEAKNQNHKVKDTNDETSAHHDGESRHVYQLYQKDRIIRSGLSEGGADDSKDANVEASDHHDDESRREYYFHQKDRIIRHVFGEDSEDNSSSPNSAVGKDLFRVGRKEGAKNNAHQQELVANEPQRQQNTVQQVGAFAVEGIGAVEERSSEMNDDLVIHNSDANNNNNEAVIDEAVLVDDDSTLGDEAVFMEQGTRRRGNKQEVIEGTIMQNSDVQSNVYPWLGLAFLAVTGLVVFLALYLPSSSNSSSVGSKSTQTVDGAANNSPIIYPPFQDDLPTITLKAFLNTSTPEYLANAWMWNDPHLASYSHGRQHQRFDLAYCYYMTNGHNWFRNDHWLSYDVNECDWFTQAHNESILHYDNYPVCDENNTLLILNLNSNNLQGTLPVVNRFLPNILTLDVGNNQLHGAAPSGAAATNEVLEVFIVSNNYFEGQLISSGGFKPFGIRIVKLDGNNLLGYLDPLHKYMTKLEIVNVTGNLFGLFGSKLAETLGSKSLYYFGNGDNLLTGTIPSTLGLIPALETIDIHGNPGLLGTIPTELGELSNLALLDVSYTNISGPVPTKLCERVETGLLEIRANSSLVDSCSVNSTPPNRY
ncbi:Leucine Rich Repeat [Seminavis robusta]|uniref:Leucine Rich Repeat n=1 Tax=Seminavis robusta TaxID=568900 RepID=A0A9N8DKX9_9STRA|nr:Leucine Rich Repeat [Seminavis robusta]|eukprot:Sro186_g080590.1 Leucine Rich Repeat (635) ;mRNA; r:14851-16755